MVGSRGDLLAVEALDLKRAQVPADRMLLAVLAKLLPRERWVLTPPEHG